MSGAVFADMVFRHSVISTALEGRNIRSNQRVRTASGFEYINILWDRTLREFTIGTIPMVRADWDYIETFHEITKGGAYGFLLEDPKDFYTTSETAYVRTTGVLAPLGGGAHQLFKRKKHIASGRYSDRKITRPQVGVQVFDAGGNPLTASVDLNTGIASVTGTPATWVGRFYIPVHFKKDDIDWSLELSGQEEVRMYSGPSVVLEEIPE